MVNSTSAKDDERAPVSNAINSSWFAGLKKILSWFSPTENEPRPKLELPNTEPFNLSIHFANISIIFTVTSNGVSEFMQNLEDPYCKGFIFQNWWVNKELICGVNVYADDQSIYPDKDSVRSKPLSRTLDKEAQTPQAPAECRNYDLEATLGIRKAPGENILVPRGTSNTGCS